MIQQLLLIQRKNIIKKLVDYLIKLQANDNDPLAHESLEAAGLTEEEEHEVHEIMINKYKLDDLGVKYAY